MTRTGLQLGSSRPALLGGPLVVVVAVVMMMMMVEVLVMVVMVMVEVAQFRGAFGKMAASQVWYKQGTE